MSHLYPLRFEPCFRQYVWGGRRLESILGKRLGSGEHYAESWEVVDHGDDQSVVRNGPLRGTALGRICRDDGVALFGSVPLGQFPLLFKYLDAQWNLSVQVHPDDEAAARLDPPDSGKTEAWVVIHAEPESRIYAGLRPGIDRDTLECELRRGAGEKCLHSFPARPGDCVFVPAGMIHAIGAGLVVAEIQQSSDTTYRLFDWNRLGSDGNPRVLHIDQGLDAVNYQFVDVGPQVPIASKCAGREHLVICDKFILDRVNTDRRVTIGGDHRFHIVSLIHGSAACQFESRIEHLVFGDTILVPAACETTFSPPASVTLLDMYMPLRDQATE